MNGSTMMARIRPAVSDADAIGRAGEQRRQDRNFAEHRDQERLQRFLQERREHEQAPDAVDDAGDAGEQFDGGKLADAVAVADARLGALALVLEILRRDADRAVREEEVVLADPRGAFQVSCWPSGACARRSRLPRRRCSRGRYRRSRRSARRDRRWRSDESASSRPRRPASLPCPPACT